MKTSIKKISSIILFSLMMSSSAWAAISQSPLFLVNSVDPNVLFNMSVENPMGGAAYNDQRDIDEGGNCSGRAGSLGVCYFPAQVYLGYFDPDKCYVYNSSGGYFEPSGETNGSHECIGDNSHKFSGNMMNWATMTAMDEFIWHMTGGDRGVDEIASETIIQRARSADLFQAKRLSSDDNVAPSTVTKYSNDTIYIYKTDFGVRFVTLNGDEEQVELDNFNVKIKVCVPDKLEANCITYTYDDNGTEVTVYKPEGLIQRNSSNMRFGVTSYSNTNGNDINGGVLRSNIKYVGPSEPDGSGGTIVNTNSEIKADGTLELNPNPKDATDSGVSLSGVIPYLNRFSKEAGYKSKDPASELFYESIRYFKNLGPTPEYLTGSNGGFPIIDNSGESKWKDPIQYSCQKNFIIGINDANPWADKKLPGTHFTEQTFNGYDLNWNDFGEPGNADPDINVTTLTNTVGVLEGLTGTEQCIGCTAELDKCDMLATRKNIPALGEVFGTCPATQKENSYYIAGLAFYANTYDLRDGDDEELLPGKQTISTFMIDTQEYSSDPLTGPMNMLWLAGKYGGFIDSNGNGEPDLDSEWSSYTDAAGDPQPDNYVLANKPEKLINALNQAFLDIQDRTSSAASVATNSTRLDTNTQLYQARFNSSDWTGQFLAFDVNSDGSIGDISWDAADVIPDETDRNIFAFKPVYDGSDDDSGIGIEFEWLNLSAAQQGLMNIDANGITDITGSEKGELRLDYIRGDTANEGTDAGNFRIRASKLGDITNSDPWFIGTLEDFGYSNLAGAEGSSYNAFRVTKRDRTPVVYVGANDGMLHAFNATVDPATGDPASGEELFTYVPNEVIASLSKLTSRLYGCGENGCIAHQYYVDGSSKGADAYFTSDSAWHTVLLGSLGGGGKAIFALDVTTPSTFSASDVLWEVSATQAYNTANKNEFSNNLGYTLPQSSLVRLNNGSWAAVVANGYESAGNKAVLYLLDIQTGEIIKTLNTGAGELSAPNGLSTPIVIDQDGDRIADYVYAGDLLGNLWKFDLTSSDPDEWVVAFSGSPLFTACSEDPCVNTQPITAKPQIGVHSDGGLMVYFGTGKYFAINDQIIGDSPQVQHFYGIRDNGLTVSGLDVLQEQQILAESTLTFDAFSIDVRVTSDTATNYSDIDLNNDGDFDDAGEAAKEGWFMKLESVELVDGVRNITAEGERVVVAPLLRSGRIVFVTMTPESDPCGWGGTSWLMEMDAETGARLDTSPFDVNGDGEFTTEDFIELYDANQDGTYSPGEEPAPTSGTRDKEMGIIKTPGVVVCEDGKECKYTSGTSGNLDMISESSASPTGRQSWNQIR